MENARECKIPSFLKPYQDTIDDGCSEIMETVKTEMSKEVQEDLSKIKKGKKVVTEKEKEAISAAVNDWTREEQLYVCRVMPYDVLVETINNSLLELSEMRREISAIARHVKNN